MDSFEGTVMFVGMAGIALWAYWLSQQRVGVVEVPPTQILGDGSQASDYNNGVLRRFFITQPDPTAIPDYLS